MLNKKVGYGLFVGGALMLYLSYVTRNFALLLFSLAFMAFTLIFISSKTKSLGLVVGSMLVSLGLADMSIPLILPMQTAPTRTLYDTNSDYIKRYFERSEDLGTLAQPGIHSSRKQTINEDVIYDVRYSIGTDGFRLTPDEGLTSEKKTRINFFGGSFTFGEGLNDDETLPYFVKSELESVSVKNYGFHGYGAHQALAILQSDRDTSGAVNFFMTVPWHAERSACIPLYTVGSPRFIVTPDRAVEEHGKCQSFQLKHPTLYEIVSRSNLYKTLRQVKAQMSLDEQLDLHFRLIEEMAKISRERGQVFVIGYLKAERDYLTGTYSNERIYQKLRDISDGIVDLTLAEDAESIARQYYIHDVDEHPSALANKQRARIVADLLVKLGVVD